MKWKFTYLKLCKNKTKKPYTKSIGCIGEQIASRFLKKHGYRIIDRNYRTKKGEIDIVAIERRFLVFVEVKLRRHSLFSSPLDAITQKKQKRIIHSAKIYLRRHRLNNLPCRIDIVSILIDKNGRIVKIELFKDVFWEDDVYSNKYYSISRRGTIKKDSQKNKVT